MAYKKISFGTDGIRGPVGKHPVTAEGFVRLGYAVGSMLREKYKNPSVIIGKDTRLSGYLFESSLQAGLISSGVNVGLLGPMPTPAVAYLAKAYGASAGAIISASHNSWSDNGVKFFANDGTKFTEQDQNKILNILEQEMLVDKNRTGKATRHTQALGRYIEFCKSSFNKNISLANLKIVLDTANGATYSVASSVFTELGAEVITINNEPDGKNINHNCGSTNTKMLSKKVVELNFDLGIAFDGDGDRVIFVDRQGNEIDGDSLLFIIGKYYQQQNKLNNNVIVGTLMTNIGIRNEFKNLGIKFIEAKVGDRFVLEEIKKNKAVLGGESSGHIICLNHSSTGDGIIAALQVLEAIKSYDEPIDNIAKGINKYPQILKNLELTDKFNLNHPELKKLIQKLTADFGVLGRVVVRKSGTEPLIRVMVEHIENKIAEKSVDSILKLIKSIS